MQSAIYLLLRDIFFSKDFGLKMSKSLAQGKFQPISIWFCLKMEGIESNADIYIKIFRFDIMKRKETFQNSETHSISFRV